MKKLLRIVYSITICFFFQTALFAQDRAVTGVVTDQNNNPLSGASITIKGRKAGVTSDDRGVFKINVPAGSEILIVSYLGARNQEISLNGRTVLTVNMDVKATKLSDVVVIGYGTQKRGDVNGAISSIDAKDILTFRNPISIR